MGHPSVVLGAHLDVRAAEHHGVVPHFANAVSSSLAAMDMGWMQVFALLHGVYFIMHYFFASQSAHVGALYPAFLSMMLASGVPPMLAALSLGFNTNLFGGLTHYASGQAACYFSSGHVPMSLLWKQGAYMAVVNLSSTARWAWRGGRCSGCGKK